MYSLLLDSADKYLGIGIALNNEIIDKVYFEAWQRQSELMVPELEKIIKKNNIDPKSINEIIVTIGPGSYTGVRIALTIAKIYAYSLNIKCYAISSLNILMNPNKPSICLMNARSNRSYFGVYDGKKLIEKDQVLTNENVKKYIDEHKDFSVCGDTKYLGIEGERNDIFINMLRLKSEGNEVKNIFSLKAVYLKD